MILRKRHHGAQRGFAAAPLEFIPSNTGGQGGVPYITLFDRDHDLYYMIELETEKEWRQMLSEVQLAGRHVGESET